MKAECQHCGASFEAKRATSKWCNSRCAGNAEYHRNKSTYKARLDTDEYRRYARERARQDRRNNPEKYAERGRRRYERLKENPEKYAENLCTRREWLAEDRKKNPDKHEAYTLSSARKARAIRATLKTISKMELNYEIK